ncbi:TPA: UvrD-helicase domain-containing protein [Providencia rettgeri]|nr:UvrD-helicase domain-containing protein [Providencia rettgeri]
MNTVYLSPTDLVELKMLVKDLNFDDTERRSALLENGSRDFNAVPGSGKTSLLAAKLLLLAKKWTHSRRGICVLSHTNVARNEIADRLASTTEGTQLLSYPHFIGTIHSFVNHFFSLPLLRSCGMKVDVIDDDVFADKARSLLRMGKFSKLRFYLENQMNGDVIATTMFYRTAELKVHVEAGSLPAPHTNSYRSLIALKEMLTEQGIFRHSDMFAFADYALKVCPRLLDVVHRRFPFVFIDEMQDTSWEQESLLNRIFDGRSTMQRFGDIDQKIIPNEEHTELLTFPREGYGCISTSKRFGKAISDAVGCVRVSGEAVVGEGGDTHAPTLLLYKTNDATKVVPYFGRMVIEQLSESDIGAREVKAMSARKRGEGNVDVGRHLLDYCPSYRGGTSSTRVRSESFWGLVGNSKDTLNKKSINSICYDIRRSLLLVLRAAGSSLVQDIRDARALPRILNTAITEKNINKLTRQLVLFSEDLSSRDQRDTLIRLLFTELEPYLPIDMNFNIFKGLNVFEDTLDIDTSNSSTSAEYEINHNERYINIGLGTVAGMKGETHAASLILESYGGTSRKFDVALGLEYITGTAKKDISKLPKTQQAQMRNLYVAMSRPTKLLCLAANENRVSKELVDILTAKGWNIEIVT